MLQKSGMSTYFYNYQMEKPGKATATGLLLLWETSFLWDIYDQVTCRRWNKWIITSSDGTDLKTFLLLIRDEHTFETRCHKKSALSVRILWNYLIFLVIHIWGLLSFFFRLRDQRDQKQQSKKKENVVTRAEVSNWAHFSITSNWIFNSEKCLWL